MKKLAAMLSSAVILAVCASAAPTFTIDASHSAGKVSPTFYGLMAEEINHLYDGGLYAELIRNRAFSDDTNTPALPVSLVDTNAVTNGMRFYRIGIGP